MKQRLNYVDFLKGFAIFLVVLGHLIGENTVESGNHPLISIIYAFHMPLFMFISGYIGQKGFQINSIKDIGQQIYKKSIALLIPYIVWAWFDANFFFARSMPLNLGEDFMNLWVSWNPLWFLWYLFVIYIFYSFHQILIQLILRKSNFFTDVVIFGLTVFLLLLIKYFKLFFFMDVDSFLLYWGFFFMGVLVSSHTFLSKIILDKTVFLLSAFIYLTTSGHYYFFDLTMENKIIKMIVAISAIFVLYNIAQKINSENQVNKRIQLWGINSLVIYVTHFAMLKLFNEKPQIEGLGNFYVLALFSLISIVIIEICIQIKKAVSFSPMLNFILYGERVKKITINEPANP